MNPGPPAWGAGEVIRGSLGSSKSSQRVTPDVDPFKYLRETVKEWGAEMSKIILENNKIILEFDSPDVTHRFIDLLRMLGLTTNIVERKIIIKYDPNFELYLRNDKNYKERTIRDYMNYLRRLDGKKLSYQLYLEVGRN